MPLDGSSDGLGLCGELGSLPLRLGELEPLLMDEPLLLLDLRERRAPRKRRWFKQGLNNRSQGHKRPARHSEAHAQMF